MVLSKPVDPAFSEDPELARRARGVARLDHVDVEILRMMQEDATASSTDIAGRIGMSQSPAWRRIAALERSGVIRKRVAVIDRSAVGLRFMAFVFVRLKDQAQATVDGFQQDARAVPEIVQCHVLMGDIDYVLVVVTRDIDAFRVLVREKLSRFSGVSGLDSRAVLEEVKNTTELPLELLLEAPAA